jgi:hypothetical protein
MTSSFMLRLVYALAAAVVVITRGPKHLVRCTAGQRKRVFL